jgi:hypothetical protein
MFAEELGIPSPISSDFLMLLGGVRVLPPDAALHAIPPEAGA